MRKLKYTQEQVVGALEKSKGLITLAADVLGCNDDTIYAYARRYQAVQAAIDRCRSRILDECESALFDAVKDRQAWAIAFTLKTIGKHRGYVERMETEGIQKVKVIVERRDESEGNHPHIAQVAPGSAPGEA